MVYFLHIASAGKSILCFLLQPPAQVAVFWRVGSTHTVSVSQRNPVHLQLREAVQPCCLQPSSPVGSLCVLECSKLHHLLLYPALLDAVAPWWYSEPCKCGLKRLEAYPSESGTTSLSVLALKSLVNWWSSQGVLQHTLWFLETCGIEASRASRLTFWTSDHGPVCFWLWKPTYIAECDCQLRQVPRFITLGIVTHLKSVFALEWEPAHNLN